MKVLFRILFFVLLIIHHPSLSAAVERSPQWWSFEVKGGAWFPRGDTVRDFLSCCHATGLLEGGLLIDSKWGLETGAGFSITGADAVGTTSGAASRDRLNFLVIPFSNSFAFRADFRENQIIVPYVKFGPDYVFFRENVQGTVTRGVKYGLHGVLGVQFLLDQIDDTSAYALEKEAGVNDIYLTLEGRYGWINDFGGAGLDLSGWMTTLGFLFEF